MAKRKRIIKKTYNEFLSWLEGVESMQEEDWVPNKIQWGKIREMLNHIKAEQPAPASTAKSPAAAPQQITAPGQPVARILNAQGVPESTFAPAPAPQRPVAPQPPPRKIPSGVPNDQESMLNPGEEHPDNEFL